jgi:hypothetical protein
MAERRKPAAHVRTADHHAIVQLGASAADAAPKGPE